MAELIFTFFPAIVIGIAAGMIPGPILTAGSTAIFQFSDGLKKAIGYCLIAGITEIFFAFVLLYGVGKYILPFLPFLQMGGGMLLLFFAYKIFLQRNHFHLVEKKEKIFSTKEIMLMLFFNGELVLFYITVLFPFIFDAQKFFFGAPMFIILFISTVTITMIAILYGISLLKKKFESTEIFQFFPYIIILSFLLFGGKALISGIWGVL